MIDYQNIADSIKYYSERGFQRIESPWTVTKQISEITKPVEAKEFNLDNGKVLVASAEQSFLYLYLKGFLPKGQFQSCTPCFRNEHFDNLHTKYFIKNELIKTDEISEKKLQDVVDIAWHFFSKKLNTTSLETILTGDDSYDITYKGIELGSYGIRSCEFLDWVYGTACAEPRLSYILNQINK
jgi:hypothetical protein